MSWNKNSTSDEKHHIDEQVSYSSVPILEEDYLPAQDAKTSKKRRAGLSEGLNLNKKAKELYKDQQNKERPWTIKR